VEDFRQSPGLRKTARGGKSNIQAKNWNLEKLQKVHLHNTIAFPSIPPGGENNRFNINFLLRAPLPLKLTGWTSSVDSSFTLSRDLDMFKRFL